jgi:uncharacterized membrane protein YdbT with pleckstrin-like domain
MSKRFRVSRKSFVSNYFFSISIVFLMLLVDMFFGLPNILFFIMLGLAFYFSLEPEYSLIYLSYEIDDEKLTETKGIISKKISVVPWRLVSKVEMRQGLFGRIFGYGNVFVSDISEAPGITLRGISNPRKVLQLIEEKITNVKS